MPKFEKGQNSELLDVLSHRRHGLRCNDYGFTYIVAGKLNKGKKSAKWQRTYDGPLRKVWFEEID